MRSDAGLVSHPPVRRLRIALITDTFHPIVGGGESHARLMGAEMAKRGHAVTVITQRRLRATPRRETLDGMTVVRVGWPGLRRLGKYLMVPGAWFEVVRPGKRFDVLYVCGMRVQGLTALAARRLRPGCAVVLRSESCDELAATYLTRGWGGLARPLVRLRNAWYRRADAFLAISSAIAQEFLSQGVDPAKVNRIPNGIDLTKFSPCTDTAPARRENRETLGLPADGALLAYSGKLNRGKGLERLIETFATLAADRPELHLVLIGGGAQQALSCERELRAQVRQLGLDQRVTFTGYTDRVGSCLRACDLFVFPSESEAFGLALVEAMASGLAVVASDVGGIPDIVTSPALGVLVPAKDASAWRAALSARLDDPAGTAEMAAQGGASVRERFESGRVAEQHLSLFASLVERKARQRHAGRKAGR